MQNNWHKNTKILPATESRSPRGLCSGNSSEAVGKLLYRLSIAGQLVKNWAANNGEKKGHLGAKFHRRKDGQRRQTAITKLLSMSSSFANLIPPLWVGVGCKKAWQRKSRVENHASSPHGGNHAAKTAWRNTAEDHRRVFFSFNCYAEISERGFWGRLFVLPPLTY